MTVLWGYESDNTPSITLEKALAIMLGVQKKSLNKILQKSLSEVKQGEKIKVDTNFVNAIPQSVPTASVLVHDRVKAPERNSKNTALISVLTISLIGTGLWGSGIFKKKETDTAQSTQQLKGFFLENEKFSNVASEPIAIQPLRDPVPPQPIPPRIDPDREALNQLQQKRESRASLIDFFKSEQSVTETKKGLLRCSTDSSEKIKTIVNDENQDRLSFFNLNAKINKITVASVVATFATSMGVDITQTEKQTVLRIHGSNTVGASLAPKLMTQFLRSQGVNNIKMNKEGVESFISYQNGDIENVIEIKAHGSSTAFAETSSSKKVGLLDRYCDLGMASRPIKDKEVKLLYDKGLGDMSLSSSEYPIALDGVAVILHPKNPISNLTVQQIADIFAGKVSNWKELGGNDSEIAIFARDEQSGTWDTFKSRVLKPFQYSLTQSNVTRYEDSSQLVKSIASNENGIGFCGLAYVDSSVKGLAVQAGENTTAFEPSRLTVKTQDYALARLLYFYLPADAPEMARDFVKFTMSNKGQEVVDSSGLVGQGLSTKADFNNANSYKDQLLKNELIPEGYKELIRNADRRDTQANLRFASGSMKLDVNSQNNINRLVGFLAESGNENLAIKLIGFTDSSGSSEQNLKLSKRRAEAVADTLRLKGVRGVSHYGFGEEMPVADNSTANGQEKNRRVEIWLQR